MIYYNYDSLVIRSMVKSDAQKFVDAFTAQNWDKPIELFDGYFNQQKNDEQTIIVAEMNKEVAGYVTIFPNSTTGPFAFKNIPEIIDLNVLIKFQKIGIGKKMMEVVEGIVKEKGDLVSLSVGLHSGYGSAQRMYVKLGYIPDGTGVWYKGKQLEQYTECVNDDDLTLYFSKQL
ncbi:GNAT family N-acetyltransferase [Virgibacillus sp. DJP39]|uniref:GNAT family N-acetyltransferase n=1 Tax=Virgibacillus sp. DJP39 TaxID=3409790 RepID=UPI003BB66521